MGRGKVHTPVRTCVSCGSKRSKADLLRLSLDSEYRLVIDVSGDMHGRGAYVCKEGGCRKHLPGNRRLNRLFRTDKTLTVGSEFRVNSRGQSDEEGSVVKFRCESGSGLKRNPFSIFPGRHR